MNGAGDWPQLPVSVHQAVRADSGFAYGVVGADIHVFGDGTPLYLLFEHHRSTGRDTGWLQAQPSRMLDARAEIVDFTGRDSELEELIAWRDSGSRFAVRWLHGEGGQGKTRLAGELAADAVRAGWVAADAVHRTDSHPPAPGSQDLRLDGRSGVLLLVDYADRWPVSDLSWLFQNRLLHQFAPARVLLIARSVSSWPAIQGKLQQLRVDADISDQKLPPLPDTSGQRDHMFTTARDCFARHYPQGVRVGQITPPGTLSHEDFGLTLAVQMAALVAVDARAFGRTTPSDMIGLTTYLLNREHENWRQLSENAVVGLDFRTTATVLARTVFTAVLAGPTDRQTARSVLTDVMPAEPADRVLADHTVCYPPTDPAGTSVLEPLLPDRLAEDFLALLLPGSPVTGYPVDEWAATGPPALLRRRENGTAPAWTPRAITFLAAAADRWPHVGTRHLFPLLGREPALALRAGSAAMSALAELPAVPIDLLEAITAHFPAGKHTDLDVGMAAVTRRLAAHHIRTTRDPARKIDIRRDLAIRLSHAGLDQETLETLQDALPDARHLAAVSPARHESRLAQILEDLAKAFRQVGRIDQAIAAAEESMEILQRLAADDPGVHEKALAQTTHTLAVSLQHTRRRDEAPAALLRKTVAIYRPLAETDPQFQRLLVAALDDLGRYKRDTGKPEEAVPLIRESLEVARRLARADSAAYEGEVARLLGNLSVILCQAGQFEEAVRTAEEAVAANRRLAAANPAAHDYTLGLALDALANACWRVNRRDEALASSEEAIEIFRRLADVNVARESNLAASLVTLGIHLSQVPGRSNEALAAAEEAAAILRRLSAEGSALYEHELAMALHIQAVAAGLTGRTSSALATAGEGITIRRRLALANPDAYDYYLAAELFALANMTGRAGRPRQAKELLVESIRIARQLAESRPAAVPPALALAQGLIALARVSLAVPGEHDQARDASTEAVELLTPLAGEQEALRPFLEEATQIRRALGGSAPSHKQRPGETGAERRTAVTEPGGLSGNARADAKLSFRQATLGGTVRLRPPGTSRAITVRLPPNVHDGQRIRLRGHKAQGANAGSPDVIYVIIKVEPDDVFSREGDTLTVRVPLTLSEASLGVDIRVPLLDGQRVTLRISKGTIGGRPLRVRSRGLPREDGTRGDLHVVAELVSDDVDAFHLREDLIAKATSDWEAYASQ